MNGPGALGSEVFRGVLQTTWQAAVLAGLILVAQLLFRKQLSPAWRYSLWLLLVVRLLVPVPPQSTLSIFNLARLEPLRERSGTATVALSPSTSPLATTAAVEKSRGAALSAAKAPEFQTITGLGDSQVVVESPAQETPRDERKFSERRRARARAWGDAAFLDRRRSVLPSDAGADRRHDPSHGEDQPGDRRGGLGGVEPLHVQGQHRLHHVHAEVG